MEKRKEIEQRLSAADPDVPDAYVVSEIMMEKIEMDESTTMLELNRKLREIIDVLRLIKNGVIRSAVAELFLRHVTLKSTMHSEMDACRKMMIVHGREFQESIKCSRRKIARLCNPFIVDGLVILTHSYSRVVLEVFKEGTRSNKHFQVYITESQPDCSGQLTKRVLEQEGIPCKVILDAEIGFYMEKVDMVLVGAECVVESGGVVNKVGCYPMAVCARELNKPFYVLAESFKYTRLYPLSQDDLRNQFRDKSSSTAEDGLLLKDYTPPSYITLLFTDLGILTPSAVSDELIKIYT